MANHFGAVKRMVFCSELLMVDEHGGFMGGLHLCVQGFSANATTKT
jgi:hypothetical protein